jgi:ElaB/YqjD/DUF883 family membrane-anchored ribosome-binding protein
MSTSSKTLSTDSGSPIADKVTETLHQSVDTLSGHAAATEEKLRKTAAESAQTMGEKQQQVRTYWDQSAIGQYTKENPVATAGIAFAAGMLLTTLLRRK